MAACSLYEEDEVYVYKSGKGYTFGLVLENSEFLSSSEEDEAELPEDRLHKGTVRVAWHPSGKENVVAEDKVQLLDRSLMPGDVVRRLIPGQESQCGFVMDMDVRCHLHVLRTNKYIYNVDSKDLLPIQKFESGQEVMLDSWLGRVEGVSVHIVLVFPDGAKCQVDENDIYPFDDVSEKRPRHGEFSVCLYYPGQELKGPIDCLSDAKWLHSTPRYCHKVVNKKGKGNNVHVTIEKIVNKNVEVHWLFRGYERGENQGESVNPPPAVVEGESVEKLKVLDWFSHCSIQIGDRMSYRIKNDDLISTVEPGKAYDPKTALVKDCPVKLPKDGDNKVSEEPEVGAAASEKEVDDGDDADFEDIEDDDSDSDEKHGACGGRSAPGRGGRKRGRNLKTNTQKHKPGRPNQHQKVTGKKRGVKERLVKADEVVEVETEFTTSWATVMWQDGSVEKDIPSVELFPVHHLDELEFFPGDFVLPNIDLLEPADYGVVVKADHAERTCLIHWFKAYDVGKATMPTVVERNCEMSVYDIKDHPDYKFRPGQSVVRVGGFEHLPADLNHTPQGVGQIFELDPNGHLVVKWADGSISQCYPQEVFIVSEDADDVSDNNSLESWCSESDYETDGSGSTWETESEQEVIGEDGSVKADKDDSGYDQGALCEHKQELDSLLGRAESALVRLQKLLNNFDVTTVSVPECFHDIIRIYRSCHDLDKILQSSFFADSELQSLISQAKKELRRDRANKISRHLSQLFEAWSNSLPAEETESVGTVAFGGKTIRIGALRKGAGVEVSFKLPPGEGEVCNTSSSFENSGAMGGDSISEGGGDDSVMEPDSSVAASVGDPKWDSISEEVKGLKKEVSEPAISNHCTKVEVANRRPSDPFSDVSPAPGAKSKNRYSDANLVGENCVSKAAKRTKSDSCDDSGHEAKKSKDETTAANHIAQELCYKICQNLQKQILKIHDEVNKRTNRLMSYAGKTSEQAVANPTMGVASEFSDTTNQTDSIAAQESNEEDWPPSAQENEHSQPAKISTGGADNPGEVGTQNTDSLPHSMDECGEKVRSEAAKQTQDGLKEGLNEAGDIGTAVQGTIDQGNEASCEVSASDASPRGEEEEVSATIEDVKAMQVPCKGFDMCGEAQSFHKFVSQSSEPANPRSFRTAVRKELKLFQSSLPDGIFIKGFEDRLDLYSVMILGPEGTPYEDALFLFDFMLPNDYPNSPPLCHYHSFCNDRLNPNLYEDGKVCVSLLGTWSGKGTEVWTSKSNLLQVLVSVQGLILVPEPYYNEAGYERQRGTQVGQENSRMYNEMAILKTVQSLTRMCKNLPTLFKEEIYQYLRSHGPKMIARLRHWMEVSEKKRQGTVGHQPNPAEKSKEGRQQPSPDPPSISYGSHNEVTTGTDNISHNKSQEAAENDDPDPASLQDNSSQENIAEIQNVQHICEMGKPSTSQLGIVAECFSNEDQLSSSVDDQYYETIRAVSALQIDSLGSSVDQIRAVESNTDTEPSIHIGQDKFPGENNTQVNGEIEGEQIAPHDKPLSQLPIGLSEPQLSLHGKPNLRNGASSDVEAGLAEGAVTSEMPASAVAGDSGEGVRVGRDVGLAESSGGQESRNTRWNLPEFPLFPMSRGFCLTLQKFLNMYEAALKQMDRPSPS